MKQHKTKQVCEAVKVIPNKVIDFPYTNGFQFNVKIGKTNPLDLLELLDYSVNEN